MSLSKVAQDSGQQHKIREILMFLQLKGFMLYHNFYNIIALYHNFVIFVP